MWRIKLGLKRIDRSSILFACILITCYINIFRSLNFGYHWDEGIQYKLLVQTVNNHIPLPLNFYNYPSFMFDISLIVGVALFIINKATGIDTFHSNYWFVPMRSIFSILCFMGIFFLFLAIKKSFGKLPAFLSGFVMMFSFQIQYHSRWIASDMLLASLVCVWIYVYFSPTKSQRFLWLYLPAILAGIGTSIKYQGAVLLLPTLINTILSKEPKKYLLVAKNSLAFLMAFLIITPGALIQSSVFIKNVLEENKHYRTTHGEYLGVQINYTSSPIEFLWHSFKYLFLVLPSSFYGIGILISMLFIIGVLQIFRTREWSKAIFLVFPLLITLTYYSTLSIWVARNFLFLFPFVLTISAAGVAYLMKRNSFKTIFILICLMLVPVGLLTTFKDAQTIVHRGNVQLVNLLKQEVERDSLTCYSASEKVLLLLTKQDISYHEETPKGSESTWLLIDTELRSHAQDIKLKRWPAYGDAIFKTIGSKEVDFNSYPYWFGDSRIILFSKEQLTYLGFTNSDLAKLNFSNSCLKFGN
jgi:MFS family permease